MNTINISQIELQINNTSGSPNIAESSLSTHEQGTIRDVDTKGTGRYKRLSLQKDSTETEKMNRIFEHYLHMFQKNEQNFLFCLTHSSFEDGMYNEAADIIKTYFDLSPYPAISWFATVFNSHIQDPNVSYRLLRCLCNSRYRKYSKNLISFVRGALNDHSVEVQEAAFMVLENWRTQECLDVIEHTGFINPLLETYVMTLKYELKEELC